MCEWAVISWVHTFFFSWSSKTLLFKAPKERGGGGDQNAYKMGQRHTQKPHQQTTYAYIPPKKKKKNMQIHFMGVHMQKSSNICVIRILFFSFLFENKKFIQRRTEAFVGVHCGNRKCHFRGVTLASRGCAPTWLRQVLSFRFGQALKKKCFFFYRACLIL